jgi:hypothetical protein
MSQCQNEDHFALLKKWFEEGKLLAKSGSAIENYSVTLKNKHAIVKRIWCSKDIPLGEKESILENLNKLDKGDWFDETSKFV